MRIGRIALAGVALMAAVALPASAQVKDYRKIKYPPLPEFKIAQPEVYTLGNGMTVFLLENHELPLISVNARIRTGSYYDPSDKVGLADLMATVQRTGGTARMTGDEIDDYLAVRAASVETGMGGSAGFASMNSLTDAFDDTFAVFADVLRTPVFSEDKLQVAKIQANAGIARRNDNVNGITAREFQRLIYGADSPLASLEEYATIAAVTRDDLVAFHASYFHPNNIHLGVVGDFESGAMKKKIEAAFGDWPEGPTFDPPELAYESESKPGVYFVEKSDVNQANIRMGHLGIEMTNPDYFAVQVLNEVLGGGLAGRLFSNVRSDKGLAYSVSGGVGSSFDHPGIFQAGLQTKSETMAEAVEALKAEITGIIDNPPSDDEMSRAKESILNSFIFRYDSKSEILSQQMTYAYYGLPSNFLDQYRESIETVTKADVSRVAETYIHPDKLTLLVVGKAEDFDKPVSTFGEVETLDITIPPPADTTPTVEKTAAALEAGASLLARAARAVGGDEPGSIRAILRSGTTTIVQGGQRMALDNETLVVFPDRVRMVLKTPMGEMTTVFDGEMGFRTAGGQTQELPASAVAEAAEELARDLYFAVQRVSDSGVEVEGVAAGKEDVLDTPCDIVAVSYEDTAFRWWIDSAGRVRKQAYMGKHPLQRTPGAVEVLFSDYREVGGLQVPFVQVTNFDGQEVMRTVFDSVVVNPEVDPAQFEKP